MVPTPHAAALAPEVASTIATLRSLISAGTAFDPATADRRFRIAASDYITTVLLVPLLRARLEGDAWFDSPEWQDAGKRPGLQRAR